MHLVQTLPACAREMSKCTD